MVVVLPDREEIIFRSIFMNDPGKVIASVEDVSEPLMS
jgi:hypothetical protein